MCIFCGTAMDSRDGHRECPGCSGRAHLLGDVKNQCPATLDLPLEERARRAGLQAALVSLTDSSSTHGGQSYEPEGKSSGRKHRSSHKPPHKHKRRRTADAVDSPALPPSSPKYKYCQMWFSLSYPCGLLGLDALSHEWPGGILYAFPPIPLIPLVLERIRQGS